MRVDSGVRCDCSESPATCLCLCVMYVSWHGLHGLQQRGVNADRRSTSVSADMMRSHFSVLCVVLCCGREW